MAETIPSQPKSKVIELPRRGPGLMAYLDLGPADRPVDAVFLHANGFNALTYRHALAPLATRYRILALDQRGHGDTGLETVVDGRRDWLDLRDDLLTFLDVLKLTHVVLAGHSMGATVSLLAAAEAPVRCWRLVLFDPVMLPPGAVASSETGLVAAAERRRTVFPSRAAALESYRGRGAFRTWPEPMLDDYVEAGFRNLPDGHVRLACSPIWEVSSYLAQQHDSGDALRRATCAIDIFKAETASTFQLNEGLEGISDHVRVITVPGTSHFLPMERPDVVRQALAGAIEPSVPPSV
jgi:pimeloyl-ACP methyl ester carboxylesterase